MRFEVQTPSRADLLFVVDNSSSMANEQIALRRSFDAVINAFATTDTSYRVAIVSSDGVGKDRDCDGGVLPPESEFNVDNHGSQGNCERPEVVLRRPHDGALGRLLAAYDPTVFADVPNNPLFSNLTAEQKTVLATLLPTSATTNTNGAYLNGQQGVPWVIDRDQIRRDACRAANVTPCDKSAAAYLTMAEPVAGALVKAFFASNIAGLGTSAAGWEEGIRTALLSGGIDARAQTEEAALDSTFALTATGRPNSVVGFDANDQPRIESWVRDDAVLGIMFVTDEQDCSMPLTLWQNRSAYENEAIPAQPLGSMCYQRDAQAGMLSTTAMADLVKKKKGSKNGRVVIGTIGGLEKTGPALNPTLSAQAVDCRDADAPEPNLQCSCLAGSEDAWCAYTANTNPSADKCDALGASRYISFAGNFTRTTFESVCRADAPAYSDTLRTFAELAKLACFALDGVTPSGATDAQKTSHITVRRTDEGSSGEPVLLNPVDPESTDVGWYYRAAENQVCLVGRERIIGDVYDIYVTTVDEIDYTR